MSESVQKKLGRVRPPRVQITYDVETGSAIEKKELPLVVGIMADLAGKTKKAVAYKDRKFIEIDKENFDAVCTALAPRLELKVKNQLVEGGSDIPVNLDIEKLDSFSPMEIIRQCDALAKVFAARQALNDLLSKVDSDDGVDELVQKYTKAKPAGGTPNV
jgi:type VI secretion system protein ImpB